MGFLNGATIVPFACLAGSSFGEEFKHAALAASETIMIAGFIGLSYVVKEVLLPDNQKKVKLEKA